MKMARNMAKIPMHQSSSIESSKFHWLVLGDESEKRPSHDLPIWETKNFVVLPSLGSLVPGWLLVVPKTPVCRIADIDPTTRNEFEELVSKVKRAVEGRYDDAYLFEHGGFSGSPISCGVDQAHLHIAPLPFDLLEAARHTLEGEDQWTLSNQNKMPYDFCGDEEYWYVSSAKRSLYEKVVSPESQRFRKLIAFHLGCAEMWDYKKHHCLENIQETVEAMGLHG